MIVNIVNGFLGSGKTTFIKNLISRPTDRGKLVVLVNEFGEIGLDGLFLAESGLEVVEMASGCVCCTLSADLKKQVERIAVQYQPDRLVIEPSGVATIDSVIKVLNNLSLERYVEAIKVILIIDASGFESLYEVAHLFVVAQIKAAQVVFINKCDQVTAREAAEIKNTVLTINNQARVFMGSYGKITNQESRLDALDMLDVVSDSIDDGEGINGPHHHVHAAEQDYESYSAELAGTFDLSLLEDFFQRLDTAYRGKIVRAKGIFNCQQGWQRVEYASRRVETADFNGQIDVSKFVFIGNDLNSMELQNEINNCMAKSGDR
ncbi:MAG: GTP-binding protein [Firmicutes bacterium]|nr:GTP-binding protein [Bacillota bacterium]